MKINNKGYTLTELLAVIVILSLLIAIMVPTVNYIITKNKEDNYKELEAAIISAAKIYLSDNRYNITLDYGDKLCGSSETTENIASIGNNNISENKLPIKILIDNELLTTNDIINPKDQRTLNLEKSYVLVEYQCSNKDYKYTLKENSLQWK